MTFVYYKLNSTERADLDKYIKFLAIKCAQVICQARLGDKIYSPCNPTGNSNRTNWFNIAILDHPEVLSATRSALETSALLATNNTTGNPNTTTTTTATTTAAAAASSATTTTATTTAATGTTANTTATASAASVPTTAATVAAVTEKSIIPGLPLSVEISLTTEEGYDMLLELWTLSIITDLNTPALRSSHAVYNAFGILLKSIISVTRATPAYKLSRRQKSESYKIEHTISAGKIPELNKLGEGFKNHRIGQVCTVFGTINMSVAYRTKMTISPTQTTGRDTSICLKSDHFLNDTSPKHLRYHHHNQRKIEKKIIDLDKPLKVGAFADAARLKAAYEHPEDEFSLPEIPPFSWLLRKTQQGVEDLSPVEDHQTTKQPLATRPVIAAQVDIKPSSLNNNPNKNNQNNNNNINNNINNNNNNNNNLLLKNSEPINIVKNADCTNSPAASPTSLTESGSHRKISSRIGSKEDDPFLLKELHFPFATDTPMHDLAKFYRDCFHAPPLSQELEAIAISTGIGNDVDDIELEGVPPIQTMARQSEISSSAAAAAAATTLVKTTNSSSSVDSGSSSIVDDLTRQLEKFETSLGDYDSLVTSLCCNQSDDVDNNSNS